MAKGRPSSRRTISATQASCAGPGSKSAATARARSTNNCTAGVPLVLGRQRWHCPNLLAADPQPFTARGHHPDVGAAGEQVLHELGGRIQHVLAVVDQEHDLGVAQDVDDPVGQGMPGRASTASAAATTSTADPAPDVASSHMTTGRSGAAGEEPAPDLGEQPGLADTTGTHEGHQPLGLDDQGHLRRQCLAADQRRRRDG